MFVTLTHSRVLPIDQRDRCSPFPCPSTISCGFPDRPRFTGSWHTGSRAFHVISPRRAWSQAFSLRGRSPPCGVLGCGVSPTRRPASYRCAGRRNASGWTSTLGGDAGRASRPASVPAPARRLRRTCGKVCEPDRARVNSDRVEAAYRCNDLFERRRNLMQHWSKCLTCTLRRLVTDGSSRRICRCRRPHPLPQPLTLTPQASRCGVAGPAVASRRREIRSSQQASSPGRRDPAASPGRLPGPLHTSLPC